MGLKTMTAQPYNIGIAGAGNISKLHLEGIARHPDRMRVAALCDPDDACLQRRAAEYSVPETYSDLETMIAGAHPDAVIVCTPTHIRRVVLLPLIEAKIPVFCEKPFAETYTEAREIEHLARQAGVPVAVNQNFRRHFTFDTARAILDGHTLGKPLHLVQCHANMRHDQGWRLARSRYVMSVMSVHWFDGYRYMLRDEPTMVFCCGVNSPATAGGEDTAVSVVLTFRRGTVVSLSESFSSFAGKSMCTLDCEAGALSMGYGALTEIRPDGEEIEHQNPFDKPEATYYLLDDLLKAASEGRSPETSATDNLKSMRILEAAYRSMVEGCAVDPEEIG